MRNAFDKFEAAGIKVYAISYDDQEVLSEYAEKQEIPFPLLSDLDSEVIRRYGIFNEQIGPDDGFYYGIPYPGVFVTDEEGVVVAKFFHDTYKKRDSAEIIIDAALGRVQLAEEAPSVATDDDDDIRITAALQGGTGSLRQGIVRHVVVRFELSEGLHIYGEPTPEGMVPTTITVSGPPGLVIEDPIFPPAEPLTLKGTDIELQVWSHTVDVKIPIYPIGELVSEVRPLDQETVAVKIQVRYQACDDTTCLLPRTESLTLELPLEAVDVPAISVHTGHGQHEGNYDGTRHMKRLLKRKGDSGNLITPPTDC